MASGHLSIQSCALGTLHCLNPLAEAFGATHQDALAASIQYASAALELGDMADGYSWCELSSNFIHDTC